MALHLSLLTSAAIPEAGDDAALIAACNAFAEFEITRQNMPDDVTDEECHSVLEAEKAVFAKLFDHRATTPEGIQARARALAIHLYPDTAGGWDKEMMDALLGDILHLPEPVDEAKKEDEAELLAPLSAEAQAALLYEDPWQVTFGSPPFRETFPLWERQPVTLAGWLRAAESEFLPLVVCEDFQRKDMAEIEKVWREVPDEAEHMLNAFIGLHRRFAKIANALHGEAMRQGLAALRVRKAGAVLDRDLFACASLAGNVLESAKVMPA